MKKTIAFITAILISVASTAGAKSLEDTKAPSVDSLKLDSKFVICNLPPVSSEKCEKKCNKNADFITFSENLKNSGDK